MAGTDYLMSPIIIVIRKSRIFVDMLKIPTRHLLLVNGLLWTAIGCRIALIGVDAYRRLPAIPWWFFLLSALVFAGFWFMFTGVVRRYARRIMAMTAPQTTIFKTFSVK